MLNLRFKLMVISSLKTAFSLIPKANKIIKNIDDYPYEMRYAMAMKVADEMRRKSRTTTKVYGLTKLPKDQTFILYPNHQGKYDGLGLMLAVYGAGHPATVLFGHKQAERIFSRQICGLIEATVIHLDDGRDIVRAINDVVEKINTGKNYIIFPEGGYTDNKNTLQEFKTGCLSCSIKTKTPIIPVCLYDSYKAMNSNTFEPVVNQIHILDPIYYEEYKDLKKIEIAELIKSKIQERLDLIESGEDIKEDYVMLL